jgi:hypothetical protein
MRRLAAIFLTFWTCVLVPTLPLAAAASEQPAACDCCNTGNCCNRDCAPPPAAAPILCTLDQPARLAPAGIRRAAKPVRRINAKFFALFVEPAATPPALPASALATPAASVPLFKVHCSFLI